MQQIGSLRAPSDRTLNRLIAGMGLVLVLGAVAFGAFYYLDRSVPAGPSLVQRSVSKYEDAVRQNPNLVSARLALAGFYAEDKRWNDAIAQYSEALKLDRANVFALLGRGDAYRQLNQLDAAAKDYQAVIEANKGTEMAKVNPQLETAYYQLGTIQLQQGKAPAAVTSLIAAVSIDRADADALNALGTAYLKVGKPDQAVIVLHDAVSFIPSGWCEPYQQMVQGFRDLKQSDGIAYASGMLAFCQGDLAGAAKSLTPLTGGQFATDALVGLGMVAEQRGDWAAAKDSYTKALAKDGQDFNAGQGLQRVLAVLNGSAPPSVGPSPAASASPSQQAASQSAAPGGNS